ncbi:MAG TPA: hypothetical protein VE978_28720 [Chitinophagales bacterium]|nr:hypothetical protein [Chitinophagales bacterium]
MAGEKDFWDKTEVLTKVFTGIVLVIIGFIIKNGADKIAQANQESQIIQKLIEDLTAEKSTTRNDIALMTLEHYLLRENKNSLDESNRKFLSNIAESILSARLMEDSTLQSDNQFSIQVLKEYDTIRYKQFYTDLQLRKIKNNTPKDIVTDPIKRVPIGNSTPEEFIAIRTIAKKLVYIQYADSSNKPAIQKLQAMCNKKGWSAPEIENVRGSYHNTIRYFNQEDSTYAKKIKHIADSVLQTSFSVVPDISTKYIVPTGQAEIWIGK